MTSLTERYLAAALRGIPDRQRTDVERELRSSIADAVEDRLAAGEGAAAAERAVLEGLGDPARFAAGISGRPLYLIGPDLFVEYRRLLLVLVGLILPITAVVLAAVDMTHGGDYVSAMLSGAGGAWTVGVHLCFWVTLAFAVVERADAASDVRDEIAGSGRWTVDRLPPLAPGRIGIGEVVGEVVTTLLSIGGLLFLNGAAWFTDATGSIIPLFNPALWSFWLPALVALLASLAGLHVVVYLVGRWTMQLAVVHGILQVAYAVPVIVLAITGTLINPAFARALGWPPLADGRGPVMLAVAGAVLLVSGWEIADGFRRARRASLATATT